MSLLSPAMMGFLRDGDTVGRYKSRSNLAQALVDSAVNRGLSEQVIFDLLLDPQNKGGERVQEEYRAGGEAQAWVYVRRCIRNANVFIEEHPAVRGKQDVDDEIDRIELALENYAWSGKAGGTDRAVALAHCALVRRSGKLDHAASVRDVAEISGVSISTVSKSHSRLAQAGWLRRTWRARGGFAARWRISIPPTARSVHTIPGGRKRSVRYEHLGHDVFRYSEGGLGKHAGRVHAVLVKLGRASVDDLLSQMPGMRRDGIRRVLRRLETTGLAERDGRMWMPTAADLDELAARLGCAGVGERQRVAHKEQRERRERERREWRARSGRAPRSVRWEIRPREVAPTTENDWVGASPRRGHPPRQEARCEGHPTNDPSPSNHDLEEGMGARVHRDFDQEGEFRQKLFGEVKQ